jgi:uncharacterized membrane protein YccC
VLALLLAQGLAPSRDIAVNAMLRAAAAAALQALFSLTTAPLDPTEYSAPRLEDLRRAGGAIRHDVRHRELGLRHALRWGLTLAVGVVAAHIVDLGGHGYWIPLTVLFVLRPEESETGERIAMRAAGTILGLVMGTPLTIALGGSPAAECVAIGVAAVFSFALLAIDTRCSRQRSPASSCFSPTPSGSRRGAPPASAGSQPCSGSCSSPWSRRSG